MATNPTWTEAKFKRFLSEKRGQGKHEQYHPWLTVSDIPSRGRSTRIFSHKANRIVHLLTDTQLRYFYLLEWNESITDINEQFPLLEMELIVDQLDESLLKRLKNSKTNVPHIMLTTFLVTAINEQGQEYQFARTLKDAAELEKKATIERLELQRVYWNSRKINFGIVTPHEIPIQKSKNIEWVLPALNIQYFGVSEREMSQYAEWMSQLITNTDEQIQSILHSFDREMKVEVGTGLLVFRYLIASRRININMDKEINLKFSPEELEVQIIDRGGETKDASNS